jgi:hypothetical protein
MSFASIVEGKGGWYLLCLVVVVLIVVSGHKKIDTADASRVGILKSKT